MVNMSESKKVIDSNVIAALIGVAGTIIVTVITINANRPSVQPTPVPTVIVVTATTAPTVIPTDTVPPGDPTSTPAPTDTPAPLPSPTATLIPVGADWANGCISSLWVPYPSSIQPVVRDGCLSQPVDKFFINGTRLDFVYNERSQGAQIIGLFAKLPPDGTAGIRFRLDEITNGEVWIGVFSQADIDSSGAVLVIPSGPNVKKQRMFLKTMPGQILFSQTMGTLDSDTGVYDAMFDFTGGTVKVRLKNNQVDLGSVTVLSPEKWLFIGYRAVNGTNRIQAGFFDLVIQER
jgi:hypothetical protein